MARQVSLNELRSMAAEARLQIWDDARQMGREPKIYLHWTAGRYDTDFDDYHVCIHGDGSIYVTTDNLSETLAHTWHRNSGSVGVTLDYPPTAKQIEAMAQVITALADALWLTIDKAHIMTHGEAADCEDGLEIHEHYGPRTTCERWDLEFLGTDESPEFNPWADDGSRGGDVLRGKANWYRQQENKEDEL